jgi:hypothetical protein
MGGGDTEAIILQQGSPCHTGFGAEEHWPHTLTRAARHAGAHSAGCVQHGMHASRHACSEAYGCIQCGGRRSGHRRPSVMVAAAAEAGQPPQTSHACRPASSHSSTRLTALVQCERHDTSRMRAGMLQASPAPSGVAAGLGLVVPSRRSASGRSALRTQCPLAAAYFGTCPITNPRRLQLSGC